MLFNTVNNYRYTADSYSYTIVTNPNGTTSNIYSTNPIQIRFGLSTSFIGDIIILTDTKLQKAALLRNIRDRQGTLVFENGVWEITQVQPLVNAAGLTEGFKYKARIIAGTN